MKIIAALSILITIGVVIYQYFDIERRNVLHAKLTLMEKSLKAKETKATKLNAQIEQLNAKVEETEKVKAQIADQEKKLAKMAALESTLKEAQDKANEYQNQIKQKDASFDQLVRKLEEQKQQFEQRIDKLSKKLAAVAVTESQSNKFFEATLNQANIGDGKAAESLEIVFHYATFFHPKSFKLTDGAQDALHKLVKIVEKNDQVPITIFGSKYEGQNEQREPLGLSNLGLFLARQDAVLKFLLQNSQMDLDYCKNIARSMFVQGPDDKSNSDLNSLHPMVIHISPVSNLAH